MRRMKRMKRMRRMMKMRNGESRSDAALIGDPLPECTWIEQAPAMRKPVYENHHQITTHTQSHPLCNIGQDEQLSQDI
jgi:hypothetical protein